MRKQRRNTGSWDMLHSSSWPAHEQLEPALVSAVEALRFFHFDGTEPLQPDAWILDYHFCDNIRFRQMNSPTSAWKQRTPGTWHLYAPNSGYNQDTRRAKLPLHALWIRFHGAEKLGLSKLVDNPGRMARINDPSDWLLQRIRALTLLGDTHDATDYTPTLIALMEIVQRLVQCRAQRPGIYLLPGETNQTPRDTLVAGIDQYLGDHLHEHVRLAHIARALHVSVSTLKRRYTQATQKSITWALIRKRIVRVKELLLQGATIAEAAEKTGFCDQFHLSKTFRQLEGIPPSKFVARLRKPSLSKTHRPHRR